MGSHTRAAIGLLRLRGTATPIREFDSSTYQCSRCGIIRSFTASRPRPELCSDCYSVLRYQEPAVKKPPREFPTHLTDDECKAGRLAHLSGVRTAEVEVAAREYWRRQAIKKRQRAREAS